MMGLVGILGAALIGAVAICAPYIVGGLLDEWLNR